MEALGHNSAAIHRAYAGKAEVELPSLEEFERATPRSNTLPFPQPRAEPAMTSSPPVSHPVNAVN